MAFVQLLQGPLEVLRKHWLVWLLFFLANGMLPLVNTIEGSFARSLVVCSEPPSALDPLFSGSAHCGDRLHVITEGQRLSSSAASVESFAKVSTALAAAVCIDLYGRRNILLAGLLSTAASVLLFVLACALPGPWARAFFVLGQGLQGALPAEMLLSQVVVDLTTGLPRAEAQTYFEVQMVIQFLPVYLFGFAASFIQVLELRDYTALWCCVLLVNSALVALALALFPEARARSQPAGHATQAGLLAGVRRELEDYRQLFVETRDMGRIEFIFAHLICSAMSSRKFAVLVFSYSMSYYDLSAARVIAYVLPIIFIHVFSASLVGAVCRALGMRRGFIIVCAFKAAACGLFVLQPYLCWAWFLQYYLSSLASGWDALMKNLSAAMFKERLSKYLALADLCKDGANILAAPAYALAFDAKATSHVARMLPGLLSFKLYLLAMAIVFHPATGVWSMFCLGLDALQREQDAASEAKREASSSKRSD